jgi:choline dehydrogenase
MQYVRGIPNDFDMWESEYGAKNWSYANVLKYFIQSENQSDMEILSKRSQYHGRDGPLELTSTLYKNESFNLDFIKAVQTLGYDYQIELNSPPYSNKRIAYLQLTLTNGHRDSTSFAFLESKKQYLRPNLHVLANSVASKVLFDNNKRAIGVRFYRNGKFYQVNATKEIILSCGAIESPKLLMLSGVGPMMHLQSKGIQVITDLPVGENFMTHVIMEIIRLADSPQYVWSLQNLYLYYLNGTGPLTKFGGFYPYSQFTTKYGNKPDIAIHTYGHQLINLLLHPLSKGKL